MAEKYYAVRKGKITGIFRSWDECRAQVHGFVGAEYKSFKTQPEALEYLSIAPGYIDVEKKTNKKPVTDTASEYEYPQEEGVIYAYVDGSYNICTKEFSYGMILLTSNGEELKFAEKYDDSMLAQMRNVAGEIKGAEAAMRYAVENSIHELRIYHDYEGIAKWCLGLWKTNKEGTKAYKAYYDSIKNKVNISFEKVKGHSKNKYNDIADELAKQALGIIYKKYQLS